MVPWWTLIIAAVVGVCMFVTLAVVLLSALAIRQNKQQMLLKAFNESQRLGNLKVYKGPGQDPRDPT